MAGRKKFNWIWLFTAVVIVGLTVATISLLVEGLQQKYRFAARNEVDAYVEFELVSGRTLVQLANNFGLMVPATGACIDNVEGAEKFLDEPHRAKLNSDRYFHLFDSDDHIWRLVVIYRNQDYRIIYIQHLSIDSLDNLIGCSSIDTIKWAIVPPSVVNGKPQLGTIMK